ncbi:MAG: VWA domain-containing protein, partial [Muribaculaceae bacterium]|nr:VWA domain-containing protein [Muribaculaceae bacterium]
QLAHPKLLWLFLLFIPLIAAYIWKHKHGSPSIKISTTTPFGNNSGGWRLILKHVMAAVKLLALGCLIIILCRPQTLDQWDESNTEGTDIAIVLDASGSMLAKDFEPSRFEAAKEMAQNFVAKRENDNMALVVFAGESFTQVPLSSDNSIIVNAIADLQMGLLKDGTAIGDGITTAINRLREGKAKSKSIILITDGTNNAGSVAPATAAEIAKADSIRIYTIGVGTNGTALMPYAQDPFTGRYIYEPQKVVIDENTLKQVANTTGGKYFRATGNKVLQNVFNEIDQLEKSSLDVKKFTHTQDNYMPWALLLLLLVLLDIVVEYTLLRRAP